MINLPNAWPAPQHDQYVEGSLESFGPNSLLKQGHQEVAIQDHAQIKFVLMWIKGKHSKIITFISLNP